MSDRKPILYGGAVLALSMLVVGILWFQSQEAPASPVTLAESVGSGTLFGDDGPGDPAMEAIPLDRTDPIAISVYLTPTCGCCAGWVQHLPEYGFEAELQYMTDPELGALKGQLGVTAELSSCHTAVVNGYVIEGHVPGDVIREFLADAPEARGIAAPGMPIGSPGMEVNGQVDPYDVLLFTSDGRTQVYSRQGRN